MTIFLMIFFGFLSGILGGMGMGGGTLLIHLKNGFLKTKGTLFLIIPGIIFSCLGALLASYIPSKILRICFGVFLCVLSLLEIIKAFKK